jgi:peptidoglycan/LPS O-acetylase OafA/YrhL
LGLFKLKPGEWSCAATYTINYLPKRSWAITHIWSLAVEEHFYLLWPLALCILGKRKGLWLAIIAVLVAQRPVACHHCGIGRALAAVSYLEMVSGTQDSDSVGNAHGL